MVEEDLQDVDLWAPPGPASGGHRVASVYLHGRLDEQFRTIQSADDRARIAVGFAFAAITVYGGGLLFLLDRGLTHLIAGTAMAGIIAVGAATWQVIRHFRAVYGFWDWEVGPTTIDVLAAAGGLRESDEVAQETGEPVFAGSSEDELAQWLSGWLAYAWDHNDERLETKLQHVTDTTKWLIYQLATVAVAITALIGALAVEVSNGSVPDGVPVQPVMHFPATTGSPADPVRGAGAVAPQPTAIR